MKGRVIKFFEDKGYGFVNDENGDSRFFHISNVKGFGEISRGTLVTFTPSNNNKGLSCTDINIIIDTKPIFISLGDTRIKLSNIKKLRTRL